MTEKTPPSIEPRVPLIEYRLVQIHRFSLAGPVDRVELERRTDLGEWVPVQTILRAEP